MGSKLAAALAAVALTAAVAAAQDNYEIQVYGADTVEPCQLMMELHSNFAFRGERDLVNGVLPTNHALHETLELTYGFTPWFETGFYVFTSARSGEGWQWVGDHIRPRVRAPDSWGWPVGVSISTEIGYQRRSYSEDTWTFELRPIVDYRSGPWYVAVNPAFEKSLHGENASRGMEFAPAVKISFDAARTVAIGVEYYGSLGPVGHFDPVSLQQHQIGPAVDLNLGPKWEFNLGALWGLTRSTDGFILKLILGRRFDF